MPTDNARSRNLLAIGLIALAAIIMAAPSIGGGYLSGDDIQLVRDHVLVNRPSLEHAGKLFTIVHRDLYQPVAMLSLSLDFAMVQMLGLVPTDASMNSIAWVAHTHNVVLHAINALLVFALLRRITERHDVALIAGLIFAVHPLNVEAVAWISGRMMLLSTLFLLLSILAMCKWEASRRWGWLIGAIVVTALCMMSKVRVCLPVLMLTPALFAWKKPSTRWWLGWGVVSLVTVAFAWINLQSSQEMISGGADHLQGSPVVRTLLAVGWYIQRLVFPTGLSPFHPADQVVSWSHPDLLKCGVVVLLGAVTVGLSMRKSRTGWVTCLWCLTAIAVTLPWLPSRNQLVAERYAYLPMVGACWGIAALLTYLLSAPWLKLHANTRKVVATCSMIAIVAACIAVSWQIIPAYRDDVARSARILAVYPDHPDSITTHAWTLLRSGAYLRAIETANEALQRHGADVACDAQQVVGMAQLALGRGDEAIESLRAAVDADPDDGRAHHRLGIALEHAARFDEALQAYGQCAELLPNFNPGLQHLARLHQRLKQNAQSRAVYEKMLANNPYDPQALAGLAELDMTERHFEHALARWSRLLEPFPAHLPARINAGVCLSELGRFAEAREQFREALHIDPQSQLATLGLVRSLSETGDRKAAMDVLDTALKHDPGNRELLDLSTRNALTIQAPQRAANHLVKAIEREPNAADLLGKYAWLCALANQWPTAEQSAGKALAIDATEPYARFVQCGVAVLNQASDEAIEITRYLLSEAVLTNAVQFDDFIAVLQSCAAASETNPWPYYILCLCASETDRPEMCHLAASEFKKRSNDTTRLQEVDAMMTPGSTE